MRHKGFRQKHKVDVGHTICVHTIAKDHKNELYSLVLCTRV